MDLLNVIRMRIITVLVCMTVLLAIGTVGCNNPPTPPLCQVQHILNADGDTLETFTYGIEKVSVWEDRDRNRLHLYTYEGSLLSREDIQLLTGEEIAYTQFQYNGSGQLIRTDRFKKNGMDEWVNFSYSSYSYNSENLLSRSRSFDPRLTPPLQLSDIEYEWEGDQIVREVFFESDPNQPDKLRIAETQTYVYDEKINPLDNIGWLRLPMSPHNITSKQQTLFIYSTNGSDTTTVEFLEKMEYNYDEYGYPVQVILTQHNGRTSRMDLFYECQE